MEFKGKKVRLVKLTDDKYNGEHPNGIYEGQERISYAQNELEVGTRFYIDDKTFKTENSTYSIEII